MTEPCFACEGAGRVLLTGKSFSVLCPGCEGTGTQGPLVRPAVVSWPAEYAPHVERARETVKGREEAPTVMGPRAAALVLDIIVSKGVKAGRAISWHLGYGGATTGMYESLGRALAKDEAGVRGVIRERERA